MLQICAAASAQRQAQPAPAASRAPAHRLAKHLDGHNIRQGLLPLSRSVPLPNSPPPKNVPEPNSLQVGSQTQTLRASAQHQANDIKGYAQGIVPLP